MVAPKKAAKAPKKKAPKAPQKKVATRKTKTKAPPKAKKVVRPDTRGGRAADRLLGVRTMKALTGVMAAVTTMATKINLGHNEEITKKEWTELVDLLEAFTSKVDASVFSVLHADGHAFLTGKIDPEEYFSDMANETAAALEGTPVIGALDALRVMAKASFKEKGFKVDMGRRKVRVVEEPVEKPTPPVAKRRWETDEEMFRDLGIA